MKILAAKFVLEANAHVPMKCDMENVALSYGKEALSHMQLGNVFDADINSCVYNFSYLRTREIFS